jgi:tetratricopeptide (TPR) repeat protein
MYTRFAEKWLGDQAGLHPVQHEFLEEALLFYQEFAREEETDPQVRHEAAVAHRRVADIQRVMGKSGQAESSLLRAIDELKQLAFERPDVAEHCDELATCFRLLGVMYLQDGRMQEATEQFECALVLWGTLATRFPGRSSYRSNAARCLSGLASVSHSTGQFANAEQSYLQAKRTAELLLGEPEVQAECLERLGAIHHNLRNVYLASGRLPEAEQAARKAIDYRRSILEASPTSRGLRHKYASDIYGLAEVQKLQSRWEDAERSLLDALKIQELLVADRSDLVDHHEDLANSLCLLGDVLHHLGRRAEADKTLRRSIRLAEALVAKTPNLIFRRVIASESMSILAAVEHEQGHNEAARRFLVDARAHTRAGLAINPRDPELIGVNASIDSLESLMSSKAPHERNTTEGR